MKYHSVRETSSQGVWVAEADGEDGEVYTAIFVGKNAGKERKNMPRGKTAPSTRKASEQPKAA